ncbi:MAG: STAS domain-containing protein [Candidatus Muiribacteriaceae bacterium]
MKFSKEVIDGVIVIAIDSDITVDSISEANEFLLNVVEGNRENIVLDFSNSDFIDSSGLSILIRINKALNLDNRKICLCNLSSTMIKVLSATKLNAVFPMASNIEQAVRMMRL